MWLVTFVVDLVDAGLCLVLVCVWFVSQRHHYDHHHVDNHQKTGAIEILKRQAPLYVCLRFPTGVQPHVVCTFTFVCTLAFQSLPMLKGQHTYGTFGKEEEELETKDAKAFISNLLIIAAGAVVAGMTVVIFAAAAAERRKSMLFWQYDNASVQAPALPEKKAFHCFISHAWASGQADARAMKASLVNLVRDLRVFLGAPTLPPPPPPSRAG